MRTAPTHTKLPPRRPALLPLIVAAALAASPAAALADVEHDPAEGKSAAKHAMPADEHAQMDKTPATRPKTEEPAGEEQDTATESHGMSAEEHAAMGADAGSGDADTAHGEHGAAAPTDDHGASTEEGEEHGGGDHGGDEAIADRPAGLLLAGFGVFNGFVLLFAAVVRRRPDARKRRETLARVRATPPKQTVFPVPAPQTAPSEEEAS